MGKESLEFNLLTKKSEEKKRSDNESENNEKSKGRFRKGQGRFVGKAGHSFAASFNWGEVDDEVQPEMLIPAKKKKRRRNDTEHQDHFPSTLSAVHSDPEPYPVPSRKNWTVPRLDGPEEIPKLPQEEDLSLPSYGRPMDDTEEDDFIRRLMETAENDDDDSEDRSARSSSGNRRKSRSDKNSAGHSKNSLSGKTKSADSIRLEEKGVKKKSDNSAERPNRSKAEDVFSDSDSGTPRSEKPVTKSSNRRGGKQEVMIEKCELNRSGFSEEEDDLKEVSKERSPKSAGRRKNRESSKGEKSLLESVDRSEMKTGSAPQNKSEKRSGGQELSGRKKKPQNDNNDISEELPVLEESLTFSTRKESAAPKTAKRPLMVTENKTDQKDSAPSDSKREEEEISKNELLRLRSQSLRFLKRSGLTSDKLDELARTKNLSPIELLHRFLNAILEIKSEDHTEETLAEPIKTSAAKSIAPADLSTDSSKEKFSETKEFISEEKDFSSEVKDNDQLAKKGKKPGSNERISDNKRAFDAPLKELSETSPKIDSDQTRFIKQEKREKQALIVAGHFSESKNELKVKDRTQEPSINISEEQDTIPDEQIPAGQKQDPKKRGVSFTEEQNRTSLNKDQLTQIPDSSDKDIEPRPKRSVGSRISKKLVKKNIAAEDSEKSNTEKMRSKKRSETDQFHFGDLKLSRITLEALKEAGYESPTPVQAGTFDRIMKGEDLIGQAQTGTGKTAAFLIPLLERIDQCPPGNDPVALIIVPTRELAVQVRDEGLKLAKNRECDIVAVYGGKPIAEQIKKLHGGVDIVVGTPGRIIDLVSRHALNFGSLHWVVLDEADRMLDIGFRPDIEKILRQTPNGRQTLLFSATLPDSVIFLGRKYMTDPQICDFSEKEIASDTIEQYYISVDRERKFDALIRLLDVEKPTQAIVFCRTKRAVDRIGHHLAGVMSGTGMIHGDLSQESRDRIMKAFRAGSVKILVATDVVGRGIDVSGISHIINYDIPQFCDDYVHRVGRTGRMGREGVAFTLVTSEEGAELTRVEKRINRLLKRRELPDFVAYSKPVHEAEEEKPSPKPVFGASRRVIRRAL